MPTWAVQFATVTEVLKDTVRTTFAEAFPDTPEVVPLEIVFDRDTHLVNRETAVALPTVMVEVWTLNRLYLVGPDLICTDVIDRRSGVRDPHVVVQCHSAYQYQRRPGLEQMIVGRIEHPFSMFMRGHDDVVS